jgi:hemerythrin superfamily protein
MSEAEEDRKRAAEYAPGDVLAILYDQHARIRETLDRMKRAGDAERGQVFAELKSLLTAHEKAEQQVVHAVTQQQAQGVAQQRLEEEQQAEDVIAKLSSLDVTGSEFDQEFTEFMQAVSDHAESEEQEEFPVVEMARDEAQRQEMGSSFLAAFRAAGGQAG